MYSYLFAIQSPMHVAIFINGFSIVVVCLMEIIFTLAPNFRMGLGQKNEDPKFN